MDLPSKSVLNRVTVELPGPAVETGRPPESGEGSSQEPTPGRRKYLPVFLLLILLGLATAVWLALARSGSKAINASNELRTATVERGDFVRTIRVNGTVEAVESHSISVPRLAGQQFFQLTITKLVPAGTRVKKGDLLVEFDRQDQIKNALDKKADYEGLVDQIKKKQADQAAALAKDETDLKQAEDALQTAKLEMRKNEIVSRIQAEKNKETLDEAEATLKQLQETFDLKRKAAAAEIKDLEIQRDRAHETMLYAERNAELMAIHSPLDGLVVLNNIWKMDKMDVVQEGDQVRSGAAFMQVVDPGAMLVRAKVNQADIPYLRVGQPVQVRLDAYPKLVFPGAVEEIGAVGNTSEMSQRVHTFTVLFSIKGSDPRLMPDLSAAVDVELERRPNCVLVPRDALVTEKGESYVKVKNSLGFEKRSVKLGPMNDVEAVVEGGLKPGAVVLRGTESGAEPISKAGA